MATKSKLTQWIPNSASKHCRQCNEKFGFLRRKHHCRECGDLVCDDCSKHKLIIDDFNKKQRVCNQCHTILNDPENPYNHYKILNPLITSHNKNNNMYRAMDKRDNNSFVAIKKIPINNNDISLEIETLKKLADQVHSKMTKYIINYEKRGYHHIVFEYSKFGTIADDMKRNKTHTITNKKEICVILFNLLKALEYLKKNDKYAAYDPNMINASNILKMENDKYKICYFGINNDNDDRKCDDNDGVWALGILAFELYFGCKYPLKSSKKEKLSYFKAMHAKDKDWSVNFQDFVITKCLAQNVKLRSSVHDLIGHIIFRNCFDFSVFELDNGGFDEKKDDEVFGLDEMENGEKEKGQYYRMKSEFVVDLKYELLVSGFVRCSLFGFSYLFLVDLVHSFYWFPLCINDFVKLKTEYNNYYLLDKNSALLSHLIPQSSSWDVLNGSLMSVELRNVKVSDDISFEMVLIYLCHHNGMEPQEIAKPVRHIEMSRNCADKWDANFSDCIPKGLTFQYILLANYLDIKSLLHLGCAKIATLIKGKSPEEIKCILAAP